VSGDVDVMHGVSGNRDMMMGGDGDVMMGGVVWMW